MQSSSRYHAVLLDLDRCRAPEPARTVIPCPQTPLPRLVSPLLGASRLPGGATRDGGISPEAALYVQPGKAVCRAYPCCCIAAFYSLPFLISVLRIRIGDPVPF